MVVVSCYSSPNDVSEEFIERSENHFIEVEKSFLNWDIRYNYCQSKYGMMQFRALQSRTRAGSSLVPTRDDSPDPTCIE